MLVLWATTGVAGLTGSELAGSKPSFLDGLHKGIIALVGGGSKGGGPYNHDVEAANQAKNRGLHPIKLKCD